MHLNYRRRTTQTVVRQRIVKILKIRFIVDPHRRACHIIFGTIVYHGSSASQQFIHSEFSDKIHTHTVER